jgi:2-polyprenyl-6-methoxyphenol hydroxylase-like FAD-dependent oxidoreductase
MPDTDVLIAGAGPTGLALALWLHHCGSRVRIVDKEALPGTTSRALAVHARTLELYRQIGLADAVVERGLAFTGANFWVRGRRVAHIELGAAGMDISPFSYVIIFPQDEHERLLIERLRAAGIEVERPVELTAFDDRGDRIVARLRRPDGAKETCEAAYLAGCDGARSNVRDLLGTGFPGGTYSHVFYVADAAATGPVMDHELHVALDDADFMAVFPLKGDGHARFIGTVKREAEERRGKLEWNDVSPGVIAHLGVNVKRINWFSTYHVHHRVVTQFRKGRAFLAGDAAHIHSPVGGQGMNTGIGDAINLAWKLAAVVQARADARLLDTYEPERIAFARRLVASTDRAFQFVTSDGPIAAFVRTRVVPLVLPHAFGSTAFRRMMFRTVSQTMINYRDSALSNGAAGKVQGGDRLPWVKLNDGSNPVTDNYTPLTALDWQVHVYGVAPSALVDACRAKGLAVHAFHWQDAMHAAGLRRNAIYLVRPDGYVGFADAEGSAEKFNRYLGEWRLMPRRPSAS